MGAGALGPICRDLLWAHAESVVGCDFFTVETALVHTRVRAPRPHGRPGRSEPRAERPSRERRVAPAHERGKPAWIAGSQRHGDRQPARREHAPVAGAPQAKGREAARGGRGNRSSR